MRTTKATATSIVISTFPFALTNAAPTPFEPQQLSSRQSSTNVSASDISALIYCLTLSPSTICLPITLKSTGNPIKFPYLLTPALSVGLTSGSATIGIYGSGSGPLGDYDSLSFNSLAWALEVYETDFCTSGECEAAQVFAYSDAGWGIMVQVTPINSTTF